MKAVDGLDKYQVMVYKNRPVSAQTKTGNGQITVKFHDGGKTVVSERDWQLFKQFVHVPKNLGPRCVVVKNWDAYKSQCN